MVVRNGISNSDSEDHIPRALRADESQFDQLVEGVRDYAIFLLDAEGNIASWNQGAERIKGYAAGEIIGKHFSKFYTAESIERGWPEYELKIARREGRFEDEGWRVRKDGSRFWAGVTITALRDEHGVTNGFLKITRDLTTRKQAEEQSAHLIREQAAREAAELSETRALFLAEASEALSASLKEEEIYAELLRIAVPFLADICIVDRLEEDGSARLAGINQSQAAPPDVRSRLNKHYPVKLADQYLVSEVLRTRKTRIFGDDFLKILGYAEQFRTEQTEFPLLKALSARSAIVVPLITRGNVLGAISFIITDFSRNYGPTEIALAQDLGRRLATAIDHARLYATAQEAQHAAEMANQAKDRFLAMLSHELRTPLTPILFSCSLLIEDTTLAEKIREHLQVVLKNAELEARLIDDLLDITRISRGKLHLNFTIADVHEVLLAVEETCSSEIANKRLLVSLDLRAANHNVRADINRLQQVFWNLLKNAIKFTPSEGRIVIRSRNSRSDVFKIEIEDSGKGIAPRIASRIFEPFEQGERSEGLGLGLTISKNIVELHGGRITASSPGPGKGSTFVVEIPTIQTADEK
jgi:PAS domain S-box-containing protein